MAEAIKKRWDIKEHLFEGKITLFLYEEDILLGGITLSKLQTKELIQDLLKCLKPAANITGVENKR